MTYETSTIFHGDPKKALAAAESIFMTNGFRVERLGTYEISVTGPGMSNSRQNPLRGVSDATLQFGGSDVQFAAKLGGVESMRNFLILFPPGLGLILMASFYLTGMWSTQVAVTVLAALSPWIVLSPLITIKIKKKTIASIETLMHNIAHAA